MVEACEEDYRQEQKLSSFFDINLHNCCTCLNSKDLFFNFQALFFGGLINGHIPSSGSGCGISLIPIGFWFSFLGPDGFVSLRNLMFIEGLI